MIPCLILLPALAAAPPQKPPAAEVPVTARVLQLPPLPASALQARVRYGGVRRLVQEGLGDLEADLMALYADPQARTELPPTLRVPRARAEEVKFLVAVVEDPDLERMTRDLHQAWDRYVEFLVRAGLAEPPEGWKPRTPPPGPAAATDTTPAPAPAAAAEEAEVATRLARRKRSAFALASEAKDLEWLASIRSARAPAGSGEVAQMQMDWTLGNHRRMEDRVEIRRQQMVVADQSAPDLAAVWAPLAAHFNEVAAKLLALDQASLREPAPDPSIRALRVQARLAFLERFRENLWFCGNVWALMTSSKPPAPLAKLDEAKHQP